MGLSRQEPLGTQVEQSCVDFQESFRIFAANLEIVCPIMFIGTQIVKRGGGETATLRVGGVSFFKRTSPAPLTFVRSVE